MYNLILAIVWLGFFLYIQFGPGQTNQSLQLYGWLMLLLVGYNLVRWWGQRTARKLGRPGETYHKPPTRRASDELKERDPNFIFDEPSDSEETNGESAPPSHDTKRF